MGSEIKEPRKPEVREALEKMASLLARGFSVRKALKIVGISSRTYAKYKDFVQSLMFKEKSNGEEKKPRKVESIMEKPETPTLDALLAERERELPQPIKELRRMVNVLDEVERIKRQLALKLGLPTTASTQEISEKLEEKREEDLEEEEREELEDMIEKLERAKERAKEFLERMGFKVVPKDVPTSVEEAKSLLEKMGYKVEDGRIPLEKVEEMLKQAEQEWKAKYNEDLEQRLEEAKIKAAEKVVSLAIDRVLRPIEMFISAYLQKALGVKVNEGVGLPEQSVSETFIGNVAEGTPTISEEEIGGTESEGTGGTENHGSRRGEKR